MSTKHPQPAARQENGRGGPAAKPARSRAPAEAPLPHTEIRRIVVGILLAMFLAALDQTIVATALPTIGRAFGDVENLSWIVTAYLLSSTAVTPLYGKLSDIYGRRALLVAAISIFIVGSIACAVAPTMLALILARGLQGLGGGGLISLAQTILADLVAPRERGRYQGYFGAVFAIASVGGPVLGGLLAQHFHWSLIFWINLPLGVVALLMSLHALRKLPRHERPHRLDFLGAALLVVASILLLLALSWGGTRFPWLSGQIGGLVAGSAAFWGLFAWRLATAEEPFLPISVLGNAIVRCSVMTGGCCMGTLVGMTIFVPLYFEVVHRLSASQSGLALIPLMASVVVAATITGRLMMHVDNYKRIAIVGLTGSILSALALAVWPLGMPIAAILALLALVGGGIGSAFPVSLVALQNAVARSQMGTATATLNFFRAMGSALVVALFGAIVLGGVGGGGGVSVEVLARSASSSDLASVFRFVFLAAALVLGFGFAFMVAMEQRPLRGSAAKDQATPDAAGAAAGPAE